MDFALPRTMSVPFEDKNGREEVGFVGVHDPCADGLRELAEEVGARGREPVAADESAVPAKFPFDPFIVEGS